MFRRWLSSNELSGTFPAQLSTLNRLSYLYVALVYGTTLQKELMIN